MPGNGDNCPAATSRIAPQPLIVRTIPARFPHSRLRPRPRRGQSLQALSPAGCQSASVVARLQGVPGSAPNTALVLGDRIWRGSVETDSSIIDLELRENHRFLQIPPQLNLHTREAAPPSLLSILPCSNSCHIIEQLSFSYSDRDRKTLLARRRRRCFLQLQFSALLRSCSSLSKRS
jgi:hypothetical protein